MTGGGNLGALLGPSNADYRLTEGWYWNILLLPILHTHSLNILVDALGIHKKCLAARQAKV